MQNRQSSEQSPDLTLLIVQSCTPLGASAHHFIAHEGDQAWTHLRLNIFPDGGVSRFRAFGMLERPE